MSSGAVTAQTETTGKPSTRGATGGAIELQQLEKRFGDFVAVNKIDLSIGAGEFFSLLGPSGCGKTTTLRLVAGFEQPSSGAILLDGVDLVHTPPHRRPVNTVFQSYALFPHLTVEDNVAYGLRWQHDGVSKADRKRRVGEAIALVRLEGLAHRKPAQLSGGQQQRVALARALVLKPSVLLLDEPLGALDAKLRKALQTELTTLQRDVGITFVYVTHDQEEALTMSDRLAVMDNGIVSQVGPPREVYTEPANAYVADFLGVANLLSVRIEGPAPEGGQRVWLGDLQLRAGGGTVSSGLAKIVIRPERARILEYGATGENHLPGMIDRLVYLGPTTQVVVRLPNGEAVQVLVANTDEQISHETGTAVTLALPADALRVLPLDDRLDTGSSDPADLEALDSE